MKQTDQMSSSVDGLLLDNGGIHLGDARDLGTWLDTLAGPSRPVITATITSPPYGRLKDYGQARQIGWGQSYDDYLTDCRHLFATLYERTFSKGSMWLIADSFRASSDVAGLSRVEPLPFTLANEAGRVGWILKDIIIWRKDRSTPWSGPGRLRNVFEYVLHFVKTKSFNYFVDRIRNPAHLEEWWVRFPERYHPLGKVPSNVWDVPIPRQGSWGEEIQARHYCPLPAELIERIILLSTDINDLVLDPFAGVGSVVAHAERLGRRGLGVEQNPEYISTYEEHLREVVTSKPPTLTDTERAEQSMSMTRRLLTLRILKLPRLIHQELKTGNQVTADSRPLILVPISNGEYKDATLDGVWAAVDLFVVFDGANKQTDGLQRAIDQAIEKRAVTTLGLKTTISIVSADEFTAMFQDQRLHAYYKGQTWRCQHTLTPVDAVDHAQTRRSNAKHDECPLILSNLYVNEKPRRIG